MSRERLNEIRSNIAASLTSKTYGQGESFAGMNAEIPAIKQELGNENALLEGTGIGLANLATRFAILYGDTCRFEIQSKLDRGTLVRVIIPLGAAIE